jgi:hypothetical protein
MSGPADKDVTSPSIPATPAIPETPSTPASVAAPTAPASKAAPAASASAAAPNWKVLRGLPHGPQRWRCAHSWIGGTIRFVAQFGFTKSWGRLLA